MHKTQRNFTEDQMQTLQLNLFEYHLKRNSIPDIKRIFNVLADHEYSLVIYKC